MKNLIFGFALAMAVLEAVAAPRSFAERLKDDQPFFIAHRGIVDNANGVKENTLASFEAAGRAKMQAIETDVRLAADGALVCSHDASLKRVFGIDLNVEKVTLAEVRKYPVPTFAEYLDVCAKYDAVPFVETKGDKKVVAPVLDELRQRGLLKVAVISSSSIDHIREARRLDKVVFVHHIFSKPALLDEIAAMGNAGLSWNYPDLRKLPPELIEKAHAKGVKCCLRGCDSPEAFREMRRLKLDYLPTNRMTPAKVRVFLDLMRTEENSPVVKDVAIETEFVVCGGGLAGVCAAVSAARHGTKVVLVQDRPVLGGNASSEMRMGICGAHGDQNYEAGILEEMQLENLYRNPLQRYTLWDDIIYSTVIREENITLLLNTSVNDVVVDGGRIAAVKAWNGNAYTRCLIRGKLFADCTGDGILRLSGAKFRRGRELPGEFGEDYLRNGSGDHRTMGNSILLQLRKTKEDHPFVAPEWAYHFTDKDFDCAQEKATDPKIVRYNYKRLYPDNNNFWWIEFGGNLDTIGDADAIRHELKKIAYGVWEYMKNHPDGRCKGYDLDWIGSLPGKRESTRFVGPHILTQGDILSGGHFEDVVAYGGWTLDDHDPDAFHKNGRISTEYKAPSPFGIPFDCLYSVNVPNLMFAGRDISATHMGLSATRVMATCAMLGQAVGTAAAIALRERVDPAVVRSNFIGELQATLEDDDQMLPYRWRKVSALTAAARTSVTNDVLRNGIDRKWDKKDNGVWVAPGEESIVYEWGKPVSLSGVRVVFDSDFRRMNKRMRKLEATTERKPMPKMLAKGFRVEVRVGGDWRTVFVDESNYRRLRHLAFDPVMADALRLVVTATWGGERAHVFALDAKLNSAGTPP